MRLSARAFPEQFGPAAGMQDDRIHCGGLVLRIIQVIGQPFPGIPGRNAIGDFHLNPLRIAARFGVRGHAAELVEYKGLAEPDATNLALENRAGERL